MELINDPRLRLSLILRLIALHSIMVGIGLIINHSTLMELFGFKICAERFFPAQGGIFHIVMAIAYIYAARDPVNNEKLVIYSIIVKFVATSFLFSYYLFVEHIPTIAMSGLGDGLMGFLIFWAWKTFKKQNIGEAEKI